MPVSYVTTKGGIRLACTHIPPQAGAKSAVTYVWLPGFRGDMGGTKARALAKWAQQAGHGFLAFDYSGHGLSGGAFADGTITAWRGEALEVIAALTDGPLVLVGSSMGAWIALLAALVLKSRIAGMVLVAPAPDFTKRLMGPSFDDKARADLMKQGFTLVEPPEGDPYPVTRALLEDGRDWCLLDGPVDLDVPVRIVHGLADDVVPWRHALLLADMLSGQDVELTLIKTGDHSLSRPDDIATLIAVSAALSQVRDG